VVVIEEQAMPAYVRDKKDDKGNYVVVDDSGHVYGRHKKKADANAQVTAVNIQLGLVPGIKPKEAHVIRTASSGYVIRDHLASPHATGTASLYRGGTPAVVDTVAPPEPLTHPKWPRDTVRPPKR
jgi:hypothetical protein